MKGQRARKTPYKREPIPDTTLETGLLEAEIQSLRQELSRKADAERIAAQSAQIAERWRRKPLEDKILRLQRKLNLWKFASLLLALGLVVSLTLR